MSARQAQRAEGRHKLRPSSRHPQSHWAHRVLDTIAAGMDVKPGYIDRALRILGDLNDGKRVNHSKPTDRSKYEIEAA